MNPILESFQSHDISLTEDEVERETTRAHERSGGLPLFAQGMTTIVAPHHSPSNPIGARFADLVEDALRTSNIDAASADTQMQLSREQVALFADGFGPPPMDPRAKAVLQLAAMQATSLSIEESAKILGASVTEVGGWLEERGLYGIDAGGECRLPIFQLDEDGHPIPHIREVLPHVSPSIHPVGVLHWFTEPNPDLASEETHFAPLSPRNWLLQKLPTDPVCELAKHVG